MFGFSFGSGISAKYSVSQKRSFHAGPWSVSSGKRKGASSNNGSSSGDSSVSVFTFNKRAFANSMAESGLTSKRILEDVYSRLRREVASLSKFRHPAVVRVIEPLEESKSTMTFVTEPLSGCLTSMIRARARAKASSMDDDSDDSGSDEFDDLAIQRGLLHISDALLFLHNTANVVHLDLQPSSILIDVKGDLKLGGMGFVEKIGETKSEDYFVPQYDPRLPSFIQVNLDYAAPELVIDRKLDPANDIFSLGCLILAIYTGHAPLETHNQPSSYKQELSSINRLFRDKSIPSYLVSSVIPSLLARDPFGRMSLESFRQSEYFDNPLVKAINFLDDFPARVPQEKKVFLEGLFTMLPKFPKAVKQKKILQALLDELLGYGGNNAAAATSSTKDASNLSNSVAAPGTALVYPLLKLILTIGKDMSQLTFTEKILPAISKVDKLQPCHVAVLDFLTILRSRLNIDDYKKSILPVLFNTLSNAEPECQRDVLLKMNLITENLDFVCLKNEVYPAVAGSFSKTTSLAVKLESLNAFCVLIDRGLDKYMITEKLIPLLAKMKSRDPNIIMASLKVYSMIKPVVDIEVLVTAVIPQLLAFSIESSLAPSQFSSLMQEIRAMMDKLEKDRKAKLIHNVEPAASPMSNSSVGQSPRSPVGNKAGTPVLDFNSLISQSSAAPAPASATSSLNLFDGISSSQSTAIKTNNNQSQTFSSMTLKPTPSTNYSSSLASRPMSSVTITPSNSIAGTRPTSTFKPLMPTTPTTAPNRPASFTPVTNSSAPSQSTNASSFKPLQPLKTPTLGNNSSTLGQQPSFAFGSTSVAPKPVTTTNDGWGDFHDSSPSQSQNQHQPVKQQNGLSQYQSLL